jgi:peptidylprolyl isomerase/FKBP-type peptidyl-prolyl cis-trans isomerase FkpA
MKSGGRRRLTVPPSLAYGERGLAPSVPPNATLVFEIELVSVE